MLNEWMLLPTWVLYSLLVLISLMVGSLLNVVIYRLPLMLQREWQVQCHELLKLPPLDLKPLNLFFPRSFCPHCKNKVTFWQNIPLLSYILLKGRCHYCKAAISIRYPIVELLTLMLSLFAAYSFGFGIPLVFALTFIWMVIPLVFIDLDHQILPDELTLSLLWIGLMANIYGYFTSLSIAVISAILAYCILWIFIKLFYLYSGKIGMGHGDFKLLAALGAWFGWTKLPFILLSSSVLGAIVGILYLYIHKQGRDTPIPFGPFLCLSGLFTLFYGNSILEWYLSFFNYR